MKSEKEISARKIIKKIISKGNSIWGATAKIALKENLENEFMILCYNACDSKFQDYCGSELIEEIIDYNVKYNGKIRNIKPYTLWVGRKKHVFKYKKGTESLTKKKKK